MNRRLLSAVFALLLIPALSPSAFALSYTDDCEKMQSDDTARYQGFSKLKPLLGLGWTGCNDSFALKVKGDVATVTYKAGGAESVRVEILTDMPTYAVNDPKEGYLFGKHPLGNIKDAIRCRYDKDYDTIFTYDAANDYVLQVENEIPKFGRMDRQCNIKSEFFGLNVAVSSGNSQFKDCGEVSLTDIHTPEDKSFYRETYMVKIPKGTVEIKLKLTFFNMLYGVDSPDIYGFDKNMLLSRVVISGDGLYMGDELPPAPSAPDTSEPDTPLPEPSRPEPSKPEPSRPEPSRPEPSRPEPSRPEPSRPESSKPEPSKPESSKPEPSKPESSKPEPSKPESSKPEPSKPESSKPEPSKPESSKPELSVPEEASSSDPVPPPVPPVPPVVPPEPSARTPSAYGGGDPVDAAGAGLINPYDTAVGGLELKTPLNSQRLDANSAAHMPDGYSDGGNYESSRENASSSAAAKVSAQWIDTASKLTGEAGGHRELLLGGGSISAVAVSYIGISLLLRRRG